ncbi:diguanylate cyclase domain-containing protein [Rhodovibrionaceae bacterium A322]
MLETHLFTSAQSEFAESAREDLTKASEKLREVSQDRKFNQRQKATIEDLLTAAAEAEQQMIEQARRIRQLENLSYTDELTGVLNRRGYQMVLRRELADAERHHRDGILLLCDLNHFKSINDTYGHMAGDRALRSVADQLRSCVRAGDYVARIGGDEFAVLMPRTPRKEVSKLVHKLEKLVNYHLVEWNGHQIPISAAMGFQVFGSQSNPEILMHQADRALYQDKKDRTAYAGENLHHDRRAPAMTAACATFNPSDY